MEWEKLEEKYGRRRRPSKVYYLLPIFLGIIGGVIGYFLLKDRDRKFAERLLIIGLVMIAVWWVLSILLSGLAYLYIAGEFAARTQGIEVVGAFCEEGTPDKARLTIRNIGTTSIDTSDITLSRTSPTSATFIWSAGTLEPSKTTSDSFECDGSGARSCSYRLTPSAGSSITATVYCT